MPTYIVHKCRKIVIKTVEYNILKVLNFNFLYRAFYTYIFRLYR